MDHLFFCFFFFCNTPQIINNDSFWISSFSNKDSEIIDDSIVAQSESLRRCQSHDKSTTPIHVEFNRVSKSFKFHHFRLFFSLFTAFPPSVLHQCIEKSPCVCCLA
jgi:hypothetical protein